MVSWPIMRLRFAFQKISQSPWLNWVCVVTLVYLLVSAVSLIGLGFKGATGERAEQLFSFATNPLLGLVVGILGTSLIQSSSTVTSIIVGLVAGGLPISIAVPMVMGANIGTSVTNSLVSVGHLNNTLEFKRAFAAATVLDFFNLLAVLILFPLEIIFQPLQTISHALAEYFSVIGDQNIEKFNLIAFLIQPIVSSAKSLCQFLPDFWANLSLIGLGVFLIIISISMMGRVLKQLLVGRAKEILQLMIGRGPLTGIFSGVMVTVMVQSSSTTTSLIVPLAGAGILDMRQVYPFTLGANVGTCVTALLAASAFSGNAGGLALEIALVHLLFNLIGVTLIYGLPVLRQIPPRAANWLGEIASTQKILAFAYVGGVFFAVPGMLLAISYVWNAA